MSAAEWFEMTEAEWLDPADDGDERRYYFLEARGLLTDRKLRLFGCASVREVWDELPDDVFRRAVLTCERHADGEATDDELRAAQQSVQRAYQGVGDVVADHTAIAVGQLCWASPLFPLGEGSSAGMSAVVAELRSGPQTPWHLARRRAKQVHCRLFREVFGNPFRPVRFAEGWRTQTVVALAGRIHTERAFDRLPILADALEDAGCDHPDVLDHCRGANQHVRGCWVVDGLLEK